jgi:hypothetical protein
MKIKSNKPEKIIRVEINKNGEQKKYLNFIQTTQKEVLDMLEGLFYDKAQEKYRVSIVTRDCVGGKNGKIMSLSYYGYSVDQVFETITNRFS